VIDIIRVRADDVRSAGDAGAQADFMCPTCKKCLNTATHGWSDVVCKCGRKWTLSVEAVGILPSLEDA
jgi:hypothetical protein